MIRQWAVHNHSNYTSDSVYRVKLVSWIAPCRSLQTAGSAGFIASTLLSFVQGAALDKLCNWPVKPGLCFCVTATVRPYATIEHWTFCVEERCCSVIQHRATRGLGLCLCMVPGGPTWDSLVFLQEMELIDIKQQMLPL